MVAARPSYSMAELPTTPVELCEEPETAQREPEIALVSDPMVHHNIYMVGAGGINAFEEDLKQEFLRQQIYLIRGV